MRSPHGSHAAPDGAEPGASPGICTRVDVELLEHATLRPEAVFSDLSWQRPQTETADPYRTCFVRDRDRVLHCGAFRRLKHKTQVFVHDQDDFYRTRLTHTLEVAQLARFLARALRLNESLAEVLALVHDIGHPPFGHEGERILHDLSGVPFDHNGQALRIVDVIESPYPDRRGLNLTHLVRRMILKHGGDAGWGAGPTAGHVLEAQLTDLADSTAYQHHDLEDALRAGVLALGDLDDLSIWRQAREESGALPEGPRGTKSILNRMLKTSLADLLAHSAAAIGGLGGLGAAEIGARELRVVGFSPDRARQHAELMRFLYERFYKSAAVTDSRAVAQDALAAIVAHYRVHPRELPPAYRRRMEDDGVARTVCDYTAGMTDRFALEEWKRLRPVVVAAPPAAAAPARPVTGEPIDAGLLEAVERLSARIGYAFHDPRLGAMALTHASARSDRFPPNERLEFLGDAVLGVLVARECYHRFPDQPEGELTRIKASIVNRHVLQVVSEDWRLLDLLRVGPGFRDRTQVPRSVVSDAVEAVLGAVFLDGGLEAASRLIVETFGARIDKAAEGRRGRNSKSELQSFTQGALGLTPNYRVLSESGPDHEKEFTVAAIVGDREVAVASGRNKREAEQRAARTALRSLAAESGTGLPDDAEGEPLDPG